METRAPASLARNPEPAATTPGVAPHFRSHAVLREARATAPGPAMLVGSSGGHLTQLHALQPWWAERERVWVTFRMPDSESLLRGELVHWAHHPTTRNVPNMFRNLRLAWSLLRQYRPSVVISTGAAVAFPFFMAARMLGIRTIYVEVFDRVDSATLTGRLCYPLSDLFLLQWEEQRAKYPKGTVIGPLL